MYASRERQKAYSKEYYESHREQIAKRVKDWYLTHKDQHAERGKRYREEHREEVNARGRAYNKSHKEQLAIKYRQNREKRLAWQKLYRESHREEMAAAQRARYAANKGHIQSLAKQRKYGLSRDAYRSLLELQGSVCAVCRTADWGGKGPMVDHDHQTGKVRGILCHYCNAALGMMRDSSAIALSAAKYLTGGVN